MCVNVQAVCHTNVLPHLTHFLSLTFSLPSLFPSLNYHHATHAFCSFGKGGNFPKVRNNTPHFKHSSSGKATIKEVSSIPESVQLKSLDNEYGSQILNKDSNLF